MTNEIKNSNNQTLVKHKYDLEERTLRFAKECIDLCKSVSNDTINQELVCQLVRASASIGANYREANEASTKRDFYHRIGISRKEAKEAKYWLELLSHSNRKYDEKISPLSDEALQLSRIFSSISRNQASI
ncbi:MAG: four helix bundle protein [Candidatus Omnitrophota bacterium]|jgi:four helix bundle protein